MPPFLPRKRPSPPPTPRQPPTKKPRLADALDAEATNNVQASTKKTFAIDSASDSDSSLSDVESDQFEDVVTNEDHNEEDNSDGEIQWEDATPAETAAQPPREALADGPIQITFRKEDDDIDYSTIRAAAKKGPTRREKLVRINTHKLHVQFLLWHNAVRNSWIGDKEVQTILVKQLPQQILQEVKKWKRASGLQKDEPDAIALKAKAQNSKRKSKKRKSARSQRDWGTPSSRLEEGKPDMSHGDPVISLMRVLAAYWRKKFAITAPGLRKRGYSTRQQLKRDIQSFRNDAHDPEKHGEKIADLESFRLIAKTCEGSRDVGAQLFTALVRGIGIEARLVASLQPSGYGWTRSEQMLPRKLVKSNEMTTASESKSSTISCGPPASVSAGKNKAASSSSAAKTAVISLDTDDEDETVSPDVDDGDDSVVDVTISMPKQKKALHDRDLAYPIYWTEVISPVTCKVIPVSPLCVESPVASTPEVLSTFEPRGAKAEKTHQVIAYVVAHSSDGTAKDVTIRYLKKSLWPGKTKGYRMPNEKIPVCDKTGRIKRYEEYDWFKHVISTYGRSTHMRTATDDIEDSTDLMPAKPNTADNASVDSLQSLKASQDFVLERFLRREEALKPDAKPDRMFVAGKGENAKEEPVYRRADVERCLTAESWHKEGRRPKLAETPMKMVPVRAVTLTRKREAEEHERTTGEKQLQGLYSWDQTEWIIPEPIKDGVIPKNSYGNMDCFVPSMVPDGAVHVPLKGTVRICKKLEIDYAEAVTGFEFGNKRAVPVCTGVVVAKEHEKAVKVAWQAYNEEQRQKEESKLEKLVLDSWKKFVIGLRIRERVAAQYGDQLNLDDKSTGLHKDDPIDLDADGEAATDSDEPGGFLPEEDAGDFGGGFLLPHEDDVAGTGELVMDDTATEQPHDIAKSSATQYPTPASIHTNLEDESQAGSDSDHSEIMKESIHVSEKHQAPSEAEQSSKVKNQTSRKASARPSEGRLADVSEEETLSDAVDEQDTKQLAGSPTASTMVNGAVSDEASDESDTERYIPRSTKRPRKAAAKEPGSSTTPTSKTASATKRGRGGKRVTSKARENMTPPTSSRKSRRKTRTALTSPYFETSE